MLSTQGALAPLATLGFGMQRLRREDTCGEHPFECELRTTDIVTVLAVRFGARRQLIPAHEKAPPGGPAGPGTTDGAGTSACNQSSLRWEP